jgi:DNA-directed RNA polymerase specialized sigma subunit
MTRDKKRYIEALLYNYKKNKARLQILELGLISDDDFILGGIDYSKERVQSSNLSSLDNKIIAREREITRLKKDIKLVEILLDSLSEREHLVVKSFYIENISNVKIADMIDRVDLKTVWRIKDNALRNMTNLI